ncbi:MAG TPA: acetylxylan esterase [Steroidobacteraceae bacterium]|nr:acetylxylan esterase [Steroidobacteraceae bacterium]
MSNSISGSFVRNMSRAGRPLAIFCAALIVSVPPQFAAAAAADAQHLVFTPFHTDGIYALGEKVGWTVTAAPGTVAPRGRFGYTIKSNDLDVVKTGSFDLSSGTATIETTFDQPAMLYVVVDYQAGFAPSLSAAEYAQVNRDLAALLQKSDPALKALLAKYPGYELLRPQFSFSAFAENRVATLGAAVAPTLLKPVVPAPADFDSFWAAQLARLRRIPVDPVLTPLPTTQPGVKLFRVRLDSVGSHVQGYLAMPDRRGKFPALILYQWAGVYALQPQWATNRAAEGWLTLDVDAHDLPPAQATGVAREYPAIGDRSRDTSYFLDMYLRDTRALQYIRSSPRWDGRTVALTGTSMGGQQSLVTAGLNPGKVTAVLVNEPAGADSNGDLHGRWAGYPSWDSGDPQVMRTALYFDTVNFAPRITAPTLIAMGFIDTTAPPAGIWTELDEIPAPKEAVPMIESQHNNLTPDKQDAWLQRSEEVLATLVHGGTFIPNGALTRPTR